jgi:sulfur carrier protein
MRLVVNGELQDVPAATLAEALRSLDLAEAKVATALNGELVKDGDRIEIVAPRQGG